MKSGWRKNGRDATGRVRWSWYDAHSPRGRGWITTEQLIAHACPPLIETRK